jgi:hypothetical protein
LEYFEDKWADHPNSIKAAKKTFKNLFLKYSGKNPSDDTVIESAENQSSEPNSYTMDSQPIIYHGDIGNRSGKIRRAWSWTTM